MDCFRAQTGWTAYDFFGGGRTFDVSGRVSKLGVGYPTRANFEQNICGYLQHDSTSDTLNYSLGATVTQPAFLNPRHSASLGVFTERRSEYQTYVRQEVGSNIGVTLNTRRAVPVVLAYQFSVGRTSANAAVYCSEFQVCKDSDQTFLAESRRFAAVTATLVRNKLDWVLDPSRGSLAILNVMYSSRFVGSDAFYEFNRGELQVAGYAPLGTRTTFAVRLRTGTILPQSITLSGQSAQFVPPEQRFYAGGPNSVRGYRLNQLGPRVYVTQDSTTIDTTTKGVAASPTGGNSVFVLNTELRVPAPVLPQRLRFALFVDMGQVWERREEIFSFTNLRITPGVGLRLTTPLGPVRLDAAYKHYADEPGPVYYLNPTTGELRRIRDSYQPPRPEGFWNRVLVQFAVGQTF